MALTRVPAIMLNQPMVPGGRLTLTTTWSGDAGPASGLVFNGMF